MNECFIGEAGGGWVVYLSDLFYDLEDGRRTLDLCIAKLK